MSLRKRLKARSLPTAEYRLRISEDSETQAALVAARYELGLAKSREEDLTEPQAKVDAAEAKLEECYETLKITALKPAEMEALIDAHPPTKKQEEAEAIWNVDTFRPALFAACIDGDMTEKDWTSFCESGQVTAGELVDLFRTVTDLNLRAPSSAVGKDWERILSSL